MYKLETYIIKLETLQERDTLTLLNISKQETFKKIINQRLDTKILLDNDTLTGIIRVKDCLTIYDFKTRTSINDSRNQIKGGRQHTKRERLTSHRPS